MSGLLLGVTLVRQQGGNLAPVEERVRPPSATIAWAADAPVVGLAISNSPVLAIVADAPAVTMEPAWVDLGQNATIAAETTADARSIWAVRHYDGNVFLGYGDWTANTGPTDLIYWDGAAYQVASSAVGTEAFDYLMVVAGDLWAPITDATTGTNPDYVRVTGTSASVVGLSEPSAVHQFWVCSKLSDGSLYLVGAYSGADNNVSVWRSANDGASWTRVHQESSTSGQRYWSIVEFAGKLWTQRNGSGSVAQTSSNGTAWGAESFRLGSLATATIQRLQVFDGELVFVEQGTHASGNAARCDGTQQGSFILIASHNNVVWDMTVADGYLYAMTANSGQTKIWRRPDLSTAWEQVGPTLSASGRSFDVHNGTVWVGATNSRVYELRGLGTLNSDTVLVDNRATQLIDIDGDVLVAA